MTHISVARAVPGVRDGVVLVGGRHDEVLLVLRQVQLADLQLHVLIESRLPETLVSPHGVLLHARVCELDDTRA